MAKQNNSRRLTGKRRLKQEGRISKHKLRAAAPGVWFDGMSAEEIQDEMARLLQAGKLGTAKHSPSVLGTPLAKDQTVLSYEQEARLLWDLENHSFGVKVLYDSQRSQYQLGLWNQTVLTTVAASGLLGGVPVSTQDHLRVVYGHKQGVHQFGFSDAEIASGRFNVLKTLKTRPRRRRP